MHSRIFQIEKKPIPESEYINSFFIPDWFTQSIADYTSDDCNRDEDIDWLRSVLESVARIDGCRLTFYAPIPCYFKKKHEAFIEAAKKLIGITLDDFVHRSDVAYTLYDLSESYREKYGFYVYYNDEIITMDDFIRYVKVDEDYFIGGTVDHHS